MHFDDVNEAADYYFATLMEDLGYPVLEKSTFLNRHNATALVDNLTRKEFYITFDGKEKKTVHFSKTFMGAMDEFVKRECSQGKPEAVNRWRPLPGHHEFRNQAWYDKNKDRAVYVWTYWTAAGFIGNLVISPTVMQVLDPADYRAKEVERKVDSRSSCQKTTLKAVIHKANALLTQ
jgi:hypothetical protein